MFKDLIILGRVSLISEIIKEKQLNNAINIINHYRTIRNLNNKL